LIFFVFVADNPRPKIRQTNFAGTGFCGPLNTVYGNSTTQEPRRNEAKSCRFKFCPEHQFSEELYNYTDV